MKPIFKFFSLTINEKRILIKLFLYIVRAEIILRLMPYSITRVFVFNNKEISHHPLTNQKNCINLYVRLLIMLCHNLPWKPTCLRIAVALRDVLATNGIKSEIKFGICRKDNKFVAHAWLKCCGVEVLKNGVYSEFTIVNESFTH